jgi:hypothetical protein
VREGGGEETWVPDGYAPPPSGVRANTRARRFAADNNRPFRGCRLVAAGFTSRARRHTMPLRRSMIGLMSQQTLDYGRPDARGRLRQLFQSRRFRRVSAYSLVLLIAYLGSYLCMSLYGSFEPEVIGLNGVKVYTWAPAGFVKNYKHRQALYYIYLPLWLADRAQWHRDGEAYGSKYPVHVPKHISEVYAAWK